MAVKKTELPALSALERDRLEELIKEFQCQVELHRQSRLELGKIASDLKPLYARLGRKGNWTKFLKELHLKVRTVDDWILDYERSCGRRKPAENKPPKGNVADSATFQKATPYVVASDNPDANGREAISATFVLTTDEKQLFIAAVRRLGHDEATQRIYRALVADQAQGSSA